MSRTEPWCPACMTAMTSRLHEARTIWWCAGCQGTFLPAQQLREIAIDETRPRTREERLKELSAASRGPLASELEAPPTRCPWCAEQMVRTRYGGDSAILIDRCDAGCGIWLDGGELERVEAWTEANRAGMIPPPSFQEGDEAPPVVATPAGAAPARPPSGSYEALDPEIVAAMVDEYRLRKQEQVKQQQLARWAAERNAAP